MYNITHNWRLCFKVKDAGYLFLKSIKTLHNEQRKKKKENSSKRNISLMAIVSLQIWITSLRYS